jgi:NitT/TauT family transport system permease protein
MGLAVETSVAAMPRAGTDRFVEFLKRALFHRRWLAFLLVLVIWQAIAMLDILALLPTPLQVAASMWRIVISGQFFGQLRHSMTRIATGFFLAILLGTTIGILMGSRRFWDAFFKDIVTLMLSLPGLIYSLLCVVIFGLGMTAPIVAIMAGSYPYVAVNVREGVKSIDKDMLDMCRAYRIGRSKMVRQVILPSLLPFILAAIRIGFTIAWKISVLTEVFGATNGIGYMIKTGFQAFAVRDVIGWSLLFGGVMLAIEYGIILPAERYFARWRPKVGEVI